MTSRQTTKVSNNKKPASGKNTYSGKNADNKKNAQAKQSAVNRKIPEAEAPRRHVLNTGTGIVLGILFALILELSNFNVLGKAGGWIKYGQCGLFGVMGYLFPVLVFLFFIIATFEEKRARMYILGSVMFLFLCAFAHLMQYQALSAKELMSFFTAGAEHQTGGGIIGGAIALGLFLMLSRTGAIIISILIILTSIFFIFGDTVKQFLDDRKENTEKEAKPENISSGKKKNSTDIPDGRYQVNEKNNGQKRIIRQSEDDPVYLIEDEEGTVIRVVRSKKKKSVSHNTPLTRSTKKAKPLRDGNTDFVRSENKVKGVGNSLDIEPKYADGDEMHEITKASKGKSSAKKAPSRNIFDDTRITDTDNTVEWEEDKAKTEKTTERKKNAGKKETAAPDKISSNERKDLSSVRAVKVSPVSGKDYSPPPMELLNRVKSKNASSAQELERIADNLELILEQFGVNVTITDIQAGPSVTRFELQPELGTRVNKITSLADDLKLNLGVTEIRIEAPIPGRQAVGIEIPNKNRQTVYMRELLQDQTLISHSSKIAFAAGKDISGNVVVADIAKMPHLLVAGTTGSGKSVFLNTILMTILYRAKPSEVGLIIIDPKKVEFGVYAGIPHLMKDVVTDPGQAVSTLRWAVNEMTIRYQRMQLSSVRDFRSYNTKVEKGTVSPQEENPRKMNQIVIIIDELADLMMVAKKEAEALICRLAQLARAAGIHLIIATQRPSVDVVTGLIKANVPARVALLVSSQIDSRTIIDMPGAEKLLGNGDMLFYPTGYVKPVRVQGAFVSDEEIQRTVDYLIKNNKTDYFEEEAQEIEKFINSVPEENEQDGQGQDQSGSGKYDEYFYEAGKCCIEMGKASSSMLQRRFNLGFNRAARIIDQLEEFGAVGAQNGAKPREILVDMATFEEMYRNMQENR